MTLFDDRAIEAAANCIWPLDGLSNDEARNELRRETASALNTAVAALDRDQLLQKMHAALCEDCHGSGALGGCLDMPCDRCHGHGATNVDRLAALGLIKP